MAFGFVTQNFRRNNNPYAAPTAPYQQRYDQSAQPGTYNPDENPASGMSPIAPALSPQQIDMYSRTQERIDWRKRGEANRASVTPAGRAAAASSPSSYLLTGTGKNMTSIPVGGGAAPGMAGGFGVDPRGTPMNDSSLHPERFSMGAAPGMFPNGPAAPRPSYDGKVWDERLKILKAQRDAYHVPGAADQSMAYEIAHRAYTGALAQQGQDFQAAQAPAPGLPQFGGQAQSAPLPPGIAAPQQAPGMASTAPAPHVQPMDGGVPIRHPILDNGNLAGYSDQAPRMAAPTLNQAPDTQIPLSMIGPETGWPGAMFQSPAGFSGGPLTPFHESVPRMSQPGPTITNPGAVTQNYAMPLPAGQQNISKPQPTMGVRVSPSAYKPRPVQNDMTSRQGWSAGPAQPQQAAQPAQPQQTAQARTATGQNGEKYRLEGNQWVRYQ